MNKYKKLINYVLAFLLVESSFNTLKDFINELITFWNNIVSKNLEVN